MTKHPAPRALLALVLLLVAAACASGRGGNADTGGDAAGISVLVDNSGAPASDITVYVLSSTGSRQLIGSVPPGQTATLRYRGSTLGGQFRLLARPTGGREIISNTFSFGRPGSTIRWNVYSNVAVPID